MVVSISSMRLQWVLFASAALAVSADARGDLARALPPSTSTAAAVIVAPGTAHADSLCESIANGNSRDRLDDELLATIAPWSQQIATLPPLESRIHTKAPAPGIIALPPDPSSASLFLSALAGVGVWQLGRSARKMNLGVLPEWYHAGAIQIGHSTPLDLDFSLSALPICLFTTPTDRGEPEPGVSRQMVEPQDRIHSQCYLLATKPRGPPALG